MRFVKWIVIIALAVFVWKAVIPWAKRQNFGGSSHASATSSSGNSCVRSGQRASELWGHGIGRFVNPPYDTAAWSDFRSTVDDAAGRAESACNCDDDSCKKVQSAMHDLKALTADLDSAIRNGSAPPSDAVQRQEAIDNQLDAAAELVRAGK